MKPRRTILPQYCSRHLSRNPQNNDCSLRVDLRVFRSVAHCRRPRVGMRPCPSVTHDAKVVKSALTAPARRRQRPNPLGRTTASGDADAFSAFIDAPMAGFASKEHTSRSVGQTKMKRRQAERPSNGFDNTPANRREMTISALPRSFRRLQGPKGKLKIIPISYAG